MATNLNPGADATLVSVAYRAAIANTPADYSDTLEKAADSYERTMEAQGKMWGNFAKLGAKIGVDMVANAKELSEYQALASGLNPEVHDMFYNELNEIKDAQKEIGFLNFTREGRKDRAELKIKQKESFAEIDLAIQSLALGTEAVASGAYDADINESESEMVNAIIKSNLKDKVTAEGNIAKLTRDEKSGELLYTMYRENGEVSMLSGVPQTMTIKEFNKSIATNVDDKGAMQANVGTYNNKRATAGAQSRDGVYDPQMKQMDLNYLDTITQTPAGLRRAFKTKIGFSNTSFFDDIQKPSALSVDLYRTLLTATDAEGNVLAEGGILEGVKDLDGIEGISQAELTNATNYGILSANILGMKDPKVSEAYFKEYASKKFEESFKYGYSNKAPAGGLIGGETFGVPTKGLRLGPMINGQYQQKESQRKVVDYLTRLKSGQEIQYQGNEYIFREGNWIQNYGFDDIEAKTIGSADDMRRDVFQTTDKSFMNLETEFEERIDHSTGKVATNIMIKDNTKKKYGTFKAGTQTISLEAIKSSLQGFNSDIVSSQDLAKFQSKIKNESNENRIKLIRQINKDNNTMIGVDKLDEMINDLIIGTDQFIIK